MTKEKTGIVKSEGVSVGELEQVKKTLCPDATKEELVLFAKYCQKTGLDPFSQQIYLIKRKGKPSFQTGIDGYRVIAERTEKYAGNDDYEFDEEFQNGKGNHPKYAKSTVYRLIEGERVPFSATARWNEYKQVYNGELGNMWAKFPSIMLGKCAEALALRKAFPNALSGVYTKEEMSQSDNSNDNASNQEVEIGKSKKSSKDIKNEQPQEGELVNMEFDEEVLSKEIAGLSLFKTRNKVLEIFGSEFKDTTKEKIVKKYGLDDFNDLDIKDLQKVYIEISKIKYDAKNKGGKDAK